MEDRPPTPRPETPDEAEVRELLQQAGPRDDLPEDDLRRIKAAFREEWRQHVDAARPASGTPPQSPSRRHTPLLALAASLAVAALLLGWWLWPDPPPQAVVATLEAATGSHEAQGGGELAVGQAVRAGDEIATTAADSHLALRLASGAALRLDGDSRLRLQSARVLELEAGAVYVDTDSASGGTLEIRTPLGVARNIGTRFEIRLLDRDGPALRLRVRDGEVELRRDSEVYSAKREGELLLTADGGLSQGRIPTFDPTWAWTAAAAPPLDLAGRTVHQVLRQIAHETGRQLRFATPEVEADVEGLRLQGGHGDLDLQQALEVALLSAGLEHRIDEGVLEIYPPGNTR